MMALSIFGKKVKEKLPYPPMPDWFIGSTPEWAVYQALIKLGMEGRFTYQSSMLGGRLAKGGAIVDFLLPSLNLAINVTSLYWHYGTSPKRASDALQRAALEGRGTRVIFIEAEDALRNPVYFVKEALKMRDHSRHARM